MRIFSWLLRAFIFFTLFAFALNNQHTASVHWFFGVEWRAPMVFVVLAAFAAGCALGAAAMLPGWWKNRLRPASPANGSAGASGTAGAAAPGPVAGPGVRTTAAPPSEFGADHPSRLGV
jgi:uncharacterized integral membrane protein